MLSACRDRTPEERGDGSAELLFFYGVELESQLQTQGTASGGPRTLTLRQHWDSDCCHGDLNRTQASLSAPRLPTQPRLTAPSRKTALSALCRILQAAIYTISVVYLVHKRIFWF